jgi:hypothetical protein
MPIKKEIIFPLFLECCQYTTDIFWENIFEDLAYGKPPYGTYISKGFLCCSYKKKEFSYKIERKTPEILHSDIYLLLKNKLGLLSQKEKIKKRAAFQNIEETMNETRKSWSKIRKKNIKDLLIEQFVINMRYKHFLSIAQSRYLLSLIFIAMVFKVITSNDIDYQNGVILGIDGISFNKKEIIFERDLYNMDISISPDIYLEKNKMSDTWEKYIKDLEKKYKI